MQQKFSLKMVSLAVATAVTLTACGGGSSSSSTANTGGSTNNIQDIAKDLLANKTATGVFLDSAVEGVEVFQKGKSIGTTDKDGKYTYFIDGGAVTFKLGELSLGSTMPKQVVTPADLTTDSQQVTRILQILQSLDDDGNLDNGIQISKNVVSRFKAEDFKTLIEEEGDDQFETNLKPKLDTNKDVVSSENAQKHFNQTAEKEITKSAELVALAKQFVGYWQQSCDGNSREVFQLKQVGNIATLVGTGEVLKRKYENEGCTGEVTESKSQSSDEPLTIKIVGQSNENGKQIVNIIRTEVDRDTKETKNFVSSLTFTGNSFADGNMSFTKVNSLAFDDTVQEQQNDAIKTLTSYLHGNYWKTCYPEEGSAKSATSYVFSTVNGSKVTFTVVAKQYFAGNNCTGNIVDTKQKNDVDEQDFSSVVQEGSTLKVGNDFTMPNANTFTADTEVYNKISASDVPR